MRSLRQCGRRWTRAVGGSRPIPRVAAPPAVPTAARWSTVRGAAPAGSPKRPKLAHLFLVRASLHHEALWEEFFSEAGDAFSIYVHPKWPENVTTGLFRNRFVPGRRPTEYGRISIVQAELCLLRASLGDAANQFFLLHSESCIPLRPFSAVYREVFALGTSWFSYHRGSMSRYRQIDARLVPEKHFYKASQFFCLSRRHAEFILANGDLTAWKNATFAEEHFLPTVLSMHGRLGECARRALTFADWSVSRRESVSSPTTFHRLLPGDAAMLEACDCLFARKFAADSDVSRHIRLGRAGQRV